MIPDDDEAEEILARERAESQPGQAGSAAASSVQPPAERAPSRTSAPPDAAGAPPASRAPERALVARGPVAELGNFLRHRQEQLAQWAAGGVNPASLIRFALLDYAKSEALQRCSRESIYLALIACAQVGLEPGGVRQEAFIVPYKGEAQFQLGYRGIIRLARRSGQVRTTVGRVVRVGDEFEYDLGTEAFVRHRPALRDRGELLCAYAFAKLDNGELEIEVMDREDLEKVRRQATRAGKESPAWRDWEDEMYRKAPIKRLGKRLPLGDDYHLAVKLDSAAERGDRDAYHEALSATGVEMAEPAPAPAGEQPARGPEALKQKLRTRRGERP